ncbi:MAG: hypothetical protein K6E33_03245 [Lachnospiraceae bacterium]|nr:hypothetical protein [Lachnospiraceae bacterium]
MEDGINDSKLDLLHLEQYDVPKSCEKCGGVMVFQGVGEYKCEDCGATAYDDYGKVRNYLETHRGATMTDISNNAGVSRQKVIRMLKEGRFEVAEGSKSFLKCEICGDPIRAGRFCAKCERELHERIEDNERKRHQAIRNMSGVSTERKNLSHGERRFMRGENGGKQ